MSPWCPRPDCGGRLVVEHTEEGGIRALCLFCARERELRPPRIAAWDAEAAVVRANRDPRGRPKGVMTEATRAVLARATVRAMEARVERRREREASG